LRPAQDNHCLQECIREEAEGQVTGVLTCSWKEAGLGDNQNTEYKCEAQASATYVCVNNGGSNPSAKNKTNVTGEVSATGTFSSGKNGAITASQTRGEENRHGRG
jgi:hypothetical protein